MGTWFRSIHFLKRSSRGQGTVEFTLVLVVSVALVLALSAKIYKPFGEYAKSYMGEYLGCLLDRGILPKLGSEDDVCSESLKLSAGNPLAPKSGAGAAGAATNGDQEKDKNKKNSSSEQNEMSSSRAGNANRVIGPTSRSSSNMGSRGADAGGTKDGKSIEVAAGGSKASKYYRFVSSGGSGYGPGKVVQVQGLGGLMAAEKEKLKRRESKISKAGVIETSEDLGKPKKLTLKPPERKIAAEKEEEPWSFSRLIRFAIIAMILIAIFVFLTGQAVQVSKSWEK